MSYVHDSADRLKKVGRNRSRPVRCLCDGLSAVFTFFGAASPRPSARTYIAPRPMKACADDSALPAPTWVMTMHIKACMLRPRHAIAI